MKIGGVEPTGPSEEVLVLPRPTGTDLVFRAAAVMDMSEFNRLVPEPKAKPRLERGGFKENLDDPAYIKAISDYASTKFAYMVLKSLEPSDIEWDTVDVSKPSTWTNWEQDLKNANLTQTEVNRVINCVSSANSLDELKLEKARESFLRGLAKVSDKSSGQNTAPESTPSGEGASDSESDPQE